MERTPHKESALKVNSGEEISPAAPAGIRTHNLSITSLALSPKSYPEIGGQHHVTSCWLLIGQSIQPITFGADHI